MLNQGEILLQCSFWLYQGTTAVTTGCSDYKSITPTSPKQDSAALSLALFGNRQKLCPFKSGETHLKCTFWLYSGTLAITTGCPDYKSITPTSPKQDLVAPAVTLFGVLGMMDFKVGWSLP